MKKTVEELAREEKRAYYRRWRAEHPERVKRYNETFWQKRAMRTMKERKDEATNGKS